MKDQQGIRLVAPYTLSESGKIASITPVSEFAVSQTPERTQRVA